MNIKLRVILLFFMFISNETKTCVIWEIGRVKIVDENGKVLENAIIWKVYSKDSFKVKKHLYSNGDVDSNIYRFWSGARRSCVDCNIFINYFRITCPGYTDVVIKELVFGAGGYEIIPLMKIVLYSPRFIQKGDFFVKFDEYRIDKASMDGDSCQIDLRQYTKAFQEEPMYVTRERLATSKYLTYPNPVKDKITVEVRDSMPLPFKVRVFDLLGKTQIEEQLTGELTEIDLTKLVAGTYYIRIDNMDGEMKHYMRLLKF